MEENNQESLAEPQTGEKEEPMKNHTGSIIKIVIALAIVGAVFVNNILLDEALAVKVIPVVINDGE